MNAPPFPINPDVGQWWQNWVWNGARWVASPTTGLRVITRTFTQSGPYMPSPGLVSCVVECLGGGGGGGGAIGTGDGATTEGWMVGGGGGGSGGYSRSSLPAALVRGGVLVTIGDGGGEGTWNVGDDGKPGGATTFGGLVMANGGQGGKSATPSGGMAGLGGDAGIGDVAQQGNSGHMTGGVLNNPGVSGGSIVGGGGGVGFFGGSGNGAYAVSSSQSWPLEAGSGAPNSGSGGGGGASAAQPWYNPGAAGGSGICIVTEYCWGDRDQPLQEWSPPMNVNLNVSSRPPKPWPPGQPGPWWPPGWPPGWGPNPPWPPGWGPWPRGTLPQGQEFEAGAEPFGPDQDPEDP